MSGIIRDTFIALHSSNVLARLDQEFRERYKGYKVPVISLRTMQVMKQLGLSSSDSDLLATYEDDSEAEVAKKTVATFELQPKQKIRKKKSDGEEALAGEAENEEAADDGEEGENVFAAGRGLTASASAEEEQAMTRDQLIKILKPGSGGRRRTKADKIQGVDKAEEFQAKFVDLTSLLPPLPKKGEFDVGKIRSSLYFFS